MVIDEADVTESELETMEPTTRRLQHMPIDPDTNSALRPIQSTRNTEKKVTTTFKTPIIAVVLSAVIPMFWKISDE